MHTWGTEAPAAPYFDRRLDAWILSRYSDVAAALRDPSLIPATALAVGKPVSIDGTGHAEFRAEALRALSPAGIGQWQEQIASIANLMAAELPTGVPVDLIERFAKPWSLQVASIAAGVPPDPQEHLAALALCIFESACEPYDEALSAAAQKATLKLSTFFQAAPPWTVQMFVALAHTLPAFLGNAWLALAEHPVEIANTTLAIEELLRFAGPAKAQFRARESGERVILRLDIANRDPSRFPDPHTLRFDGRATGHLAFGAGEHACVGAALIRSAAAVATETVLRRFLFCEPYTAIPVDCFAIRYVSSLKLILKEDARRPALCL
jgi:cytochrome P450